MQEPTPEERRVQIIAAVAGLVVAIAFAVYVGSREGAEIGVAVFVLSWTFIALFVLVVRTVYRRFVAQPEAPAPQPQQQPAQPTRSQQRRRRRKR